MFKKIKGGHHSERKTTKERSVMSYEDMPLEDYEQEKTEMSPEAVKKIIIGICVALAAGLVVFAFSNRDKLSWDNISVWWTYDVLGNPGKGYPVDIIGSEVKSGNFAVNQNRVAYASDTSFVTLNSSGSEVANIQLRYSKPVMKSCENKFLAYGLGEKGYQIFNYDSNLYTGEAQGIVYTGDIASNGTYCLACEDSGFLTQLSVFNKDNNRIYKYYFSEYYINSVALNNDGSGCVACGITTEGGAVKTGVYVLDFDKKDPVNKYEIVNDAVFDCKYIARNRAVLVGENAAYIIKYGEKDYINVSYDDKPIVNYCFNPTTNSFALAMSKSGDGRSCELVCYNENGEKRFSVASGCGAESMSLFKNSVAVLDGNTAHIFDNAGVEQYKHDCGTGSKNLILTSEKSFYLLSVNQVRYVDMGRMKSTDDSVTE